MKTPKAGDKKKLDYILRDIPGNLWRTFKSKVALEGTNIRAKLIELIKEYIGE